MMSQKILKNLNELSAELNILSKHKMLDKSSLTRGITSNHRIQNVIPVY